MNCQDAEPFLLDASDSLDAEVRAHFAVCAQCQATQAALAESEALLRAHLVGTPPPALRTEFYATLSDLQRQQRKSASVGERFPAWRPRLLRLAVAFLVVFALGALSMRLVQGRGDSGADINAVLAQLENPSPATRLTGVYTVAETAMAEARVQEALVAVIRNDPSVNVRVAALETLTLYAEEAPVRAAVVQVLGSDPAPLVQLAALRFIERHQSAEVRQALDALLEQPDLEPLVRAQVRTLLTTSI